MANRAQDSKHDWLLRMPALRIDDRAFPDLIRKWLKAGIPDTDGSVLHPAAGAPQGGIVSPVLANLYLHHALDLWVERVVKPRCRGEVLLCRYADDFVCAFRFETDARRLFRALPNGWSSLAWSWRPRRRRFCVSAASIRVCNGAQPLRVSSCSGFRTGKAFHG
jgi:hypothetical protein